MHQTDKTIKKPQNNQMKFLEQAMKQSKRHQLFIIQQIKTLFLNR